MICAASCGSRMIALSVTSSSSRVAGTWCSRNIANTRAGKPPSAKSAADRFTATEKSSPSRCHAPSCAIAASSTQRDRSGNTDARSASGMNSAGEMLPSVG